MTEATEMDWAEGVGAEDLIAVGSKVIEMAGKLSFCPGANVEWNFEMAGFPRFQTLRKKARQMISTKVNRNSSYSVTSYSFH